MSGPPKLSFSLGSSTKITPKLPSAFAKAFPDAGPSKPSASTSLQFAPKSTAASTSKRPAIIFDDEDDEEPSAPVASSSRGGPAKNSGLIKQNSAVTPAAWRVQEQAMAVDETVFQYDEVWDGMKEAQKKVASAKEDAEAERKPKYIEAFLSSASTRRLDRLRAEEKMLQHERDQEGEEFADKDKFVTGAYKKQMEEVRAAEEAERLKEEKDKKSKIGPGMTTFYRTMLDADEEKHAAAVAAASAPKAKVAGPSLAIKKPPTAPQYDPEPEADAYLLREAALHAAVASKGPVVERLEATNAADGEKVEINDEGAVVDHRVLLKAGLNITKKPIAPLPTLSGSSSAAASTPYQSRAVGTAASHAERMKREKQRLAEMLAEEQDRTERAKMEREKEEEEKARKRREGGLSVEEGEAKRKAAKERFEERKRRKLEETAVGKGTEED